MGKPSLARTMWLLVSAGALSACAKDGPELSGTTWREADGLFTHDPSFIGGDGAYSVDLGDGRVLWMFGDSYVATSAARRRSESHMVRNSVAIQTGYDPTRAFMRFYYRLVDRQPASFFPEQGALWYWPGPGIRLGSKLLLFGGRLYQAEEGMWGFDGAGSVAFIVDNADDEPSDWQLTETELPAEGSQVQMGGALLVAGDYLYAYGAEGDHHDVHLARFELGEAREGRLGRAEWWTGDAFGDGSTRRPVIAPGAPEFSVHFAEQLGRYLFVASEGFGATTLAVRSSKTPWGPWSEPRDVVRPPESFADEAFVYAGKAHPELTGADLVATYVPSSFAGDRADPDEQLYYPRFLRLTYP